MAERDVKTITRTVTISNLTAAEMASIFAQWNNADQAAFFNAVGAEAASWPNGGWYMQGSWIGTDLDALGRDVINTIAENIPS